MVLEKYVAFVAGTASAVLESIWLALTATIHYLAPIATLLATASVVGIGSAATTKKVETPTATQEDIGKVVKYMMARKIIGVMSSSERCIKDASFILRGATGLRVISKPNQSLKKERIKEIIRKFQSNIKALNEAYTIF